MGIPRITRFILLSALSLSLAAIPSARADSTCNALLRGTEASLHDLAKLRFELDRKRAEGASGAVTRALEAEYAMKESEILKSDSFLDPDALRARLTDEIHRIQQNEDFDSNEQMRVREEQFGAMATATEFHARKVGDLLEARSTLHPILLPDGRILIAGGEGRYGKELTSVEVLNPTTGQAEKLGDFPYRSRIKASELLPDGRVIALDLSDDISANVIDPAKNTIRQIGKFRERRNGFALQVFPDGRVWVIGGLRQRSVEVFRSKSNSGLKQLLRMVQSQHWGDSLASRWGDFTPVLLANGRVLLIGGKESSDDSPVSLIEELDPENGTATEWGHLLEPRIGASVIPLKNGQILVVGGRKKVGQSAEELVSSIEMIDPAQGTVEKWGDLLEPRIDFGWAELPDGRVLIVGGNCERNGPPVSSVETIDLRNHVVEKVGDLLEARHQPGVMALPDGRVWMMGGSGADAWGLSSIEELKVGRE